MCMLLSLFVALSQLSVRVGILVLVLKYWSVNVRELVFEGRSVGVLVLECCSVQVLELECLTRAQSVGVFAC